MTENKKSLRPLQKEAVEKCLYFLKSNPERGVYNASEQGTGKTPVTIEVLNRLSPRSILIICPAVVRLNWKEELQTWLNLPDQSSMWPIAEVILSKSQVPSRGVIPADIVIISYDLVRNSKVLSSLSRRTWDVLVLDESHKVKNSKAKTTKAVLKELWPRAHYRIALSGTPFTSTIEDCWTVFSRMSPSSFPYYFSFVNTFCYQERTPWGIKYYGLKNHEVLKRIIRKEFFFRYTKEEMAPELPPKQWCQITLPYSEYAVVPTDEEREEHKHYLELLKSFLGQDRGIPQPPKHIQTKRREQGIKKLPAVFELVKELVDSQTPTVVFFCFLETLHLFRKMMSSQNPSIITGEVDQLRRYEAISRFQSGDTNLLISQIHAGGIGINLTRGEAVVLAEMDYSPSVIGQAVDRCHRIGQKGSVMVYYPIVENTIEFEAMKIVMSKAKTFKKVVDNDE